MKDWQFVFFEYFMTDHYGHKRKKEELIRSIEVLDRFASAVASGLDLEEEAMLIVSDHGNAEDMTTGGHTGNFVPGLLVGGGLEMRESFSRSKSLTDIYNFFLEYYKN
nr:hypothetical protein [Spirochaeta isovalerica]